jgi:hypothetical protein
MMQSAPAVVMALGFAGWLLSGTRRRSLALWLGTALFAVMLGGISGCGDDGYKNNMPVISSITITAISQNTSHSTTITLAQSN